MKENSNDYKFSIKIALDNAKKELIYQKIPIKSALWKNIGNGLMMV